ncbi:MAG: ribosomal protein S18-alanine N-acetyltransferase [Chloroflexi bacterium]|nr:ribosomal protein S18-alanine N-acetyltransferase [Chloroflexota bacterium]
MVRVQLQVAVRPMALADVPQVSAIDREAFPTLWPPPAFKDELLHNKIARYLVVWEVDEHYRSAAEAAPTASNPEGGLLSTVRRLFGGGETRELPPARVLGLVGIWFMADEAHITTIAVRQQYRRQGLGELLLIAALELAQERQARVATLEVRASNLSAQALYDKYGFAQVGVRPKYYTDNNEDAFIMTTEVLTSPAFQGRFQPLRERFFASFPGRRRPDIVLS